MNFITKLVFVAAYLLIARYVHAESRKVIAVIDTGMPAKALINSYLCNIPHYDVTGYGIEDVHGHGTNIAGIIASKMNVQTHCLLIIKWWHSEETSGKATGTENYKNVRRYVDVLGKVKPDYINLSLSGDAYMMYEANVFRSLLDRGTTIVAAAGNDGKDLDVRCDIYPACYRIRHSNFRIVGSRDKFMDRLHNFSNYGKVVTDYRHGVGVCGFGVCISGTSQSTAVLTSDLISGNVD